MTDALRRELSRWGFSDGEIDVYLAVLEVGEGPASEVAELADVSARHVYRVCERLEARGLVDVDEHVQPSHVRARESDAVEEVVERSSTTIVEEVRSLNRRSPEEPTDIEVLKRQPTVLARLRTLVADAERWLVLVAPPDVVAELADELAAAVDRDVLVLLVTTVESLSIDRPLADLATVVRTRDGPQGFQEVGIGVDKVRSLLVSDSADMGDELPYSPALYLDDETVGVRGSDSLMGIEWRQGREYAVPEPASLPHEFTFFREAVLHAALHHRSDAPLRATVEGRSGADGSRETVDGEVVAVRQGTVEPCEQEFVGERTLVLDVDGDRVSVGGSEATVEEYAAESITLYAADEAT